MASKKPQRSVTKRPSKAAERRAKQSAATRRARATWPRRWWDGPLYARAKAAGATPVEAAYVAAGGFWGIQVEPALLPKPGEIRDYLKKIRPVAVLEESDVLRALKEALPSRWYDDARAPHVALRVRAIKRDYDEAQRFATFRPAGLGKDLRDVATLAKKLGGVLKQPGVETSLELVCGDAEEKLYWKRSASIGPGEPVSLAIDTSGRLTFSDVPRVAPLVLEVLKLLAPRAAQFRELAVRDGNPGKVVTRALTAILWPCFLEAGGDKVSKREGRYARFGTFFRLVAKALGDNDLASKTNGALREYLP